MHIQDWLSKNKENIIKIIELEDVLSKSDSCKQPYKSQYAARDILQSCITDLDEWMNENKNQCDHLAYFIFFNLSYRLANNFISTEERYSGEEIIFSLCRKIEGISYLGLFLKQLNITPNGDIGKSAKNGDDNLPVSESAESQEWIRWLAGTLLRIYNASGLLWSGRMMSTCLPDESLLDDPGYRNSTKYLTRAKRIYKIYKHRMSRSIDKPVKSHTDITLNYEAPQCFDGLLLSEFQYETPYFTNECYLMEATDRREALNFDVFESDYTTTLFLLAQTFGKMTGRADMKRKSAKYCYCTLYRQLNAFKYDPVEWSLNAATLSQYYVVNGVFPRARHCIAAAQTILKEAVNRPTPAPKDETKKSNKSKSNDDTVKATESQTNVSEKKDINTKTEKHCGSEVIGDCNKTTESILEDSISKVVEQLELKESAKKDENENIIGDSVDCRMETVSNGSTTEVPKNSEEKEKSKPRQLLPDPMSESRLWDDDVYEEKRVQGEADIDRCWVSYGLNLLELSFDRKFPDYNGSIENDNAVTDSKLPDFNLELAAIERQVTCEWVYTYEEARELFLFVQKKINSARQYYKLDFRCSDAIDLICDHSKAFKAISSFEMSTDRKCAMHKKRIDMLTELLKTLNQKYYLIPCRKMMLEVGEIYSTMMNLKLSLLEISPENSELIKLPPNAKGVVQKLRLLGKKGLNVYENFLESYRNPNGVMPEAFSEEDIRPVMIAHFYMARMFSKILEPEPKARLNNLVTSLKHYQFIVDYCQRHDAAAKQMSSELESCRDMTVLLPRKIDKLRSEC